MKMGLMIIVKISITLPNIGGKLDIYIADLDQFIADLKAFEVFATENADDLKKYGVHDDAAGLVSDLADTRSKVSQGQENHQKLLDMVNGFM